jgi:hypothetical protein
MNGKLYSCRNVLDSIIHTQLTWVILTDRNTINELSDSFFRLPDSIEKKKRLSFAYLVEVQSADSKGQFNEIGIVYMHY